MADIFREVDEALKEDKAKVLWQRYGSAAIAIVVLVVLATGGYVFWQDYSLRRDQERTAALMAAVELADAERSAAVDALERLADEAGDRQGLLARLHGAALLAEAGDTAAAVAAYRELADDRSVAAPWRDLGRFLAVLHDLESGDRNALTEELAPLMVEESPWRHSARELEGLIALRAGDSARAREIFSALADDPQTPGRQRQRAQALADVAGS
ncbi:MAG: tetratricopeptide repeat protein [Inquilinus sp.]|nr:tetratricopeptide repeat protein [Inquilinus sp.]